MAEHLELWPVFEPVIAPLLGEEDDPTLWPVVLDIIYADAQALARLVAGPTACSRRSVGALTGWLRIKPDGLRTAASPGRRVIRAPTGSRAFRNSTGSDSGRGVHGHRTGWSPMTDHHPGTWCFVWLFPRRHCQHRQAAVHTVWRPGAPPLPRAEVMQFYGFRRRMAKWTCTAYRYWSPKDQRVYEETVEA